VTPWQSLFENISNFWMAHKPKTMSEVYSHLHEGVEVRKLVDVAGIEPATPCLQNRQAKQAPVSKNERK
jgi:hypothetical protein